MRGDPREDTIGIPAGAEDRIESIVIDVRYVTHVIAERTFRAGPIGPVGSEAQIWQISAEAEMAR